MLELFLLGLFTVAWIVIRPAKPVFADLKCGDAPPVRFGRDSLVIAWTGPVPANAKVSTVDRSAFKQVSNNLGSSLPNALSEKYTKNRFESDVFNASMAWDIDESVRWNDRYGMKLGERPLGLFSEYLDTGNYVIFQSLVEHPPVTNFERFAVCSVAFQRGDIYMVRGQEHLFLRSYFHSHSDEDRNNFANFGPTGGLRISFETEALWYPLRVTRLNGEPTTVVLNVFTDDPLNLEQLPRGFEVERTGWMPSDVGRYFFSRLTASFEGGQDVPDLSIPIA